jgi:hypothetical protein
LEKHFFNQDGAWPHIVNAVLDVLNEHFGDSVLPTNFPEWSRCGWFWPSYSPDFNQCDYFLWGFLKDSVYRSNSHVIQELNQEILSAVISISEEILAAVV